MLNNWLRPAKGRARIPDRRTSVPRLAHARGGPPIVLRRLEGDTRCDTRSSPSISSWPPAGGPGRRAAEADADAPAAGRRPGGRRIASGRAFRRQDRDRQARRRRGAPRPDPVGGPRGDGQGRGQRRGGHAVVGQLPVAGLGGRRPGRLPDHGGLSLQQRRGPVGARRGRPDPALARRVALDRADELRLPGPPALVRLDDPDGQRAGLRRRRREARDAEGLLSQRPRHRRGRGPGRGRRGDRRRRRQLGHRPAGRARRLPRPPAIRRRLPARRPGMVLPL